MTEIGQKIERIEEGKVSQTEAYSRRFVTEFNRLEQHHIMHTRIQVLINMLHYKDSLAFSGAD